MMSDEFPQTTQMVRWLEQMQAGDLGAREEILRHVRGRLERLTRKMLQDYPRVKRYEATDECCSAILRLLAPCGRTAQPTREFLGLASLQIRARVAGSGQALLWTRGGRRQSRQSPS